MLSHPAHRAELTPRRARALARIVPHVAVSDPGDDRPGTLLRSRDLPPEVLLLGIVARRVPGDAVAARGGPQQPAGLAVTGERPIQPAERLDPDEVAQHEHVQRDLQPQLALDLGRRMRLLPRLVVPDDAARGEGSRSTRSILPESRNVSRSSPRCSSGAERSDPNDTSNLRGTSGSSESASARTSPSRSRQSPCSSSMRSRSVSSSRDSAPPAIASARHSRMNVEGLVESLRRDAFGVEPLRQPGEELEQRLVGDRPAHPRIDLGVHRLRVDHPLDEPDRRAARRTTPAR